MRSSAGSEFKPGDRARLTHKARDILARHRGQEVEIDAKYLSEGGLVTYSVTLANGLQVATVFPAELEPIT